MPRAAVPARVGVALEQSQHEHEPAVKMRVVVHAASGRSPVGVAGAPAAIVGVIVCLARIGVVGTRVVLGLTVTALFALLRLYPAFYRRRKSSARGGALRAEASWEGTPGVLRIYRDRLEFSPKKPGDAIVLAKWDISVADLFDVRSLVRATRAALETERGDMIHCTITAPAADVAEALQNGFR